MINCLNTLSNASQFSPESNEFFSATSFLLFAVLMLLPPQHTLVFIQAFFSSLDVENKIAAEERDERRKKETFNCKRGTLLNEQTNKEELMLSIMTL
jgi:hypothetical protein